jgi:hypothetical protein
LAALVLVTAALEVIRRRKAPGDAVRNRVRAIDAGLVLGLLWVVEILGNNIVAPALPGRDIFDNVVWAVISVAIASVAALTARRTRSLRAGIRAGAWAGFASGLVACLTALCVIVFGMSLLMADPLNVKEWATLGVTTGATGMASYFALETLAGAIGHLLVIGLAMGAVLGAVGGTIGSLATKRRHESASTRS